MTTALSDVSQLPLKTTEEEEIQEVTASLAAAKEDAAVVTLSVFRTGRLFCVIRRKKQNGRRSSAEKVFLLDSCLTLATL